MYAWKVKQNKNTGFTIVELLIVIVVIAILAAIAFVSYNGVRERAIESSLKSDVRNAMGQVESDNTVNGAYPVSATAANGGQGLKASGSNQLSYVLKPYGYCVSAANPSSISKFAYKASVGAIAAGDCQITSNTISGSGTNGYQDGSSSTAQFSCLYGLAIDSSGQMYVGTDAAPGHIRKIATDGSVSTLATLGTTSPYCPIVRAVDSVGNVYFTGNHTSLLHRIWKVTPAGVVTVFAGAATSGNTDANGINARFNGPYGIDIDSSDNLYVADTSNHRIRKITPSGDVTTIAGTVGGYVDGAALTTARFYNPFDVAIDKAGILYVADGGNCLIRKINTDGTVSKLAGVQWAYTNLDGPGTTATFGEISHIEVDQAGIVYTVDYDSFRIRKTVPDGTVSTVVGTSGTGYVDGTGTTVRFGAVQGIDLDSKGDLYVADNGNRRIRKILQ